MKIINKKDIHKKDWKSFVEWSTNGYFLFGDINFYSGFLSINKEDKLEKYLIDFFLYNRFVLGDRYALNWPGWIKEIKGNNIDSWTINLFSIHFDEKEIFLEILTFLTNIREYKQYGLKDWDKEYRLAKDHWSLTHKLRKKNIKNYNNWIVYINEHTHTSLKGYK